MQNVRTLGSFFYEDPESWRKFLIPDWSLDDFGCQNDIYKYQGSFVQNFRSIGAFESPECPPRSIGGYFRFQNGV